MEPTNAVEVTVRFILDTVTKMWVWKLTDASGSTIAKSAIQYATEAEASAAFEDYKNGGDVTDVAPEEEKVADTETAPVTPEATEPVATEPTAPEAPESAPTEPEATEVVPGTEPVATEEATAPVVDETAGTAEATPAEGVATAE